MGPWVGLLGTWYNSAAPFDIAGVAVWSGGDAIENAAALTVAVADHHDVCAGAVSAPISLRRSWP
jgi:hypothetical protein